MRRLALVLAVLGGCGGGGGEDTSVPLPKACEAPISGTNITFRLVAQTQGAALLVTSPPNDIRRFVVEQEGRIKVLEDTGLSATPFLDVSSEIVAGGEQGLLGLAFHPQYALNRRFFIYYTQAGTGAIRVSSFVASAANPDLADAASEQEVITIPHPGFTNHNGG